MFCPLNRIKRIPCLRDWNREIGQGLGKFQRKKIFHYFLCWICLYSVCKKHPRGKMEISRTEWQKYPWTAKPQSYYMAPSAFLVRREDIVVFVWKKVRIPYHSHSGKTIFNQCWCFRWDVNHIRSSSSKHATESCPRKQDEHLTESSEVENYGFIP